MSNLSLGCWTGLLKDDFLQGIDTSGIEGAEDADGVVGMIINKKYLFL